MTSDEIEDEQQYIGPTSTEYNPKDYDSNKNTDNNSTINYSSGDNECIIIVGQFGVRSNANKFENQVEADGYDTFSGKNSKRGLNMVGVKFSYDSESEKEDMLRKLQNEYDNAAWIYKE